MNTIHTSLAGLFLFLCLGIYGQNSYDQQWHFGDGISIDFSSGNPELGASSTSTATNVEPASVCNNLGQLMAYTDGDTVYNAAGTAVINGGFDYSAQENIFSAIPGEPNKFYLFRSSEDFGVSWSIIDLMAGDGQGEILDDEKQQVFRSHFSQLMVTSHADMFNFWLVLVNNNSGEGGSIQMSSYTVASDGIEEISEFSQDYIFATWYNQIEEARMSPTCERIATSHKGHYLTMYEFDNATGQVSTGFDQSANSLDSFSRENLNYIDFSPSGEYLYVIRDNTTVIRFDATLSDPILFLESEEDLGFSNLNYTHIKRGPNGKIYLLDQNNQMLDAIEAADSESPTLVQGAVAIEANARFFPNTMNSCQAFTAIQVTDVCIGDSTSFISNIGAEADSVFWTINGNGIQDTIYNLFSFYELFPNAGDYDISFNFLFDTLWTSIDDIASVYAQPQVDLGPDIAACQGDVIELTVGQQVYDYSWNTGDTLPIIEVTNSGIYSALIINGLCSAYDEVEVNFTQVPFSYLEDLVICDTIYPISLDASGEHVDNYQWLNGPAIATQTVDTTGVYSITLSNECFSIEDSASVTYILFPDNLLDDEYSICGSDTLLLSSIYPFGNIQWSNGDVGVNAEILGQGNYTLEIEHLGCYISEAFFVDRIKYVDVNQLIMPNVVSFNDDSLNKAFRPFVPWNPHEEICSYSSLSVNQKIYNRWGNLLEEGGCSWNGESPSEQLVSEGTYYYIIDLYAKCLHHESERRISDHFQVFE